MLSAISRQTLAEYINETLPAAEAARVERSLRDRPELMALLDVVRAELAPDDHTLGAIWAREHLTCPTRETLAGLLQDILPAEQARYVRFHLDEVGCVRCRANRDDLERLAEEPTGTRAARRQRIVESSAGVLPRAAGKRPG